MAQAGGDRLLGAGILDSMSHRATSTGRFREAANLAPSSQNRDDRLGEAKACDLALAATVTEYERRMTSRRTGYPDHYLMS
jgi:hypothetical protein